LRLHPEKGLNPHLTVCSRCGGEGREIILLGNQNKVFKCTSCGQVHIGRPKKGLCRKCGNGVEFERDIDDYERLPGDLCDNCKEEIKTFKKIVAEGGIYWKCEECHREGVIKVDAPLAKAVRKQLNVSPPDACGVALTKKECPACNPPEKIEETSK